MKIIHNKQQFKRLFSLALGSFLLSFAISQSVAAVPAPQGNPEGPSYTTVCATKTNAQNCATTVQKEVEQACGRLSSFQDRTGCQTDQAAKTAARFQNAASTSGGASGGSSTTGSQGSNFDSTFAKNASVEKKYQCGNGDDAVKVAFNFGCLGTSYTKGELGPIQDLAFALIRFFSIGVGIVVAASIVYAGIQYTTSEGNADATQKAKNRIRNSVVALILYMLIFAVVQYLVPGGAFVADSTDASSRLALSQYDKDRSIT